VALQKIITGKNDGVERASRDVALNLRIRWSEGEGGPCIQDTRVENRDYISNNWRDENNNTITRIRLADGLLILSRGERLEQIDFYRHIALKKHLKLLHVDLSQRSMTDGAGLISSWIALQHLNVLQVTGPDETTAPGIYQQTKRLLTLALIESIVGLDLNDSVDGMESLTSKPINHSAPSSVEAAADELINEMSLKECVKIARLGEDELVQLKLTLGILIQDKLCFWMGNETFRRACLYGSKSKLWDDYSIACLILRIMRNKLRHTHRLRVIK
jgi:hypothetical protein